MHWPTRWQLQLRALTSITAILLLGGCGAEPPGVRDLGAVGGGKADLAEIELDLPCLAKRGPGDADQLQLTFSGSGPFQAALTQPGVTASKQAYGRFELDDGETQHRSASSRTPVLAWYPPSAADLPYALVVENRSSTRQLCGRLQLTALPPFAPPTERRLFSASLALGASTKKVAIAFFDADSTLRVTKGGAVTPNAPDDVVLLPGAATGVRQAMLRGDLVVIVSNQGGVGAGYTTYATAEGALATTAALLADKGANIAYFDFATDKNEDRKPQPGMAKRLEQAIAAELGRQVDWSRSYMVGDAGWKKQDSEPDGTAGIDFSNSDRLFAEGLSIPFYHPRDYYGWIQYGVRRIDSAQQVEDFRKAHPDFPE